MAINLFDDLYEYCSQSKAGGHYAQRVDDRAIVVNKANRVAGKTIGQVRVRRGDAIIGQSVPGQTPIPRPGAFVSAGPLATLQVGAEVKIIATAMGKQFDRVVGNIRDQAEIFAKMNPNSIKVAFIGVNHSMNYRSFEGDRTYDSRPGKEAQQTMRALANELANSIYDEILLMPYEISNIPPFPFAWRNWQQTYTNYNAALVRLANIYQSRFP
jgi:hypothetical protein